MGRVIRLLTLALSSLSTTSALASVLVVPVDGVNLDEGEIAAIEQLIASSYRAESRETVIGAAEAKRAMSEVGTHKEAAENLGASEYIHVTATRLETKIVLSATLYSSDGTAKHTAKITATSLDDLEPASERLAKALLERQSSKNVRDLDNVTSTEGGKTNRVETQKYAGFKTALAVPIGWTDPVSTILLGGVSIRRESDSNFIEFGLGIMIPAGNYDFAYGGVYGDLGLNFYLMQADTSPYLGFGVMPRLASREVANLAPYAQAGVTFFRVSTTRLYVEFKVAQNVLPVGVARETWDGEVVLLYPTELTGAMGVAW